MNSDAGGWLWLVIDVGFVVILAVALVYGIYMWRTARATKLSSAFVTKRHEKPTATRMGRSQLLILATSASDTSKFA